MEPIYSDDQLLLASRLYFIDGLPQARIARLVNVSQSKVSRMLALARQRGLVRVSVPDYQPRNLDVERRLQEQLGVRSIVVRSIPGLRVGELRQTLGYFAAPIVSEWIRPGDVVAMAGGRTIQSLVENMRPSARLAGVTLVQAMGNIDASPGAYDAVELCRKLAHLLGGTLLTLNTPAILPDADTCRRFLALEQIRKVMERLAQSDIAFVGIGTLDNSVFVERKVLGSRDIDEMRARGAVGEVLGRFFDASGRECDSSLSERVVSLRLEHLKRISQVVAVVTGADRCSALAAAIRGGIVKSLVIDEGGAAAALESAG